MTERRIEHQVVPVKSGSNTTDMEVRHVAPQRKRLEEAAEERGVIIFNPGIGGGIPEEGEPIASRIADETGMAVAIHSQTLSELIRGTNVFESAVPASRETAARLVEQVFARYEGQLDGRAPVNVAQSLGSLSFAVTQGLYGKDNVDPAMLIAPAFLSQEAEDFYQQHNLDGASLDEVVANIPWLEKHWKRLAARKAVNFAAIGGSRELRTAIGSRDWGILPATLAINTEMAPAGPRQAFQAFGVLALASVLPLVRNARHVVSGSRDPFVDSEYLDSAFDSRFHILDGGGHDHPKTISGARTHTFALQKAGLSYPVDS